MSKYENSKKGELLKFMEYALEEELISTLSKTKKKDTSKETSNFVEENFYDLN